MGLEPTTLSLDPPVGGLPTELRFIQIFSTKFPALCSLSGKWGSNPRPSAWEADALPTELLPLVSAAKIKFFIGCTNF